MRKVDLSMNPLGEAGGRALFRTILRGLRCFVVMRGCSYKVQALPACLPSSQRRAIT